MKPVQSLHILLIIFLKTIFTLRYYKNNNLRYHRNIDLKSLFIE